MAALTRWRSVQHAKCASLRHAFVYSGAAYFLHDYYPGATTLLEFHFSHLDGALLTLNNVMYLQRQYRHTCDSGINFVELLVAAGFSLAGASCDSWSAHSYFTFMD